MKCIDCDIEMEGRVDDGMYIGAEMYHKCNYCPAVHSDSIRRDKANRGR